MAEQLFQYLCTVNNTLSEPVERGLVDLEISSSALKAISVQAKQSKGLAEKQRGNAKQDQNLLERFRM